MMESEKSEKKHYVGETENVLHVQMNAQHSDIEH